MTDKNIPKSFRFSKEDEALIEQVKSTYGLVTQMAAVRFALTSVLRGGSPAKAPPSTSGMEETLARLGKQRFDVCEVHQGYYHSCWKNHG